MPSYLITGASRGLGYTFVQHLAAIPGNTVIGLARNKDATLKRLEKDGISNVSIIQGDITDRPSLKTAFAEISTLTNGSLDYLINNAALVSERTASKTLIDDDLEALEQDFLDSFRANVVGVANTINIFLPLIRAGKEKKIIVISTGMADVDLINKFDIPIAAPYSVSKAATNALVAKYNAALGKSEGILVLALSATHTGNFHAANGFSPDGFHGILSAVATAGIIFSYLGFEQADQLAGEAKNPRRDLPIAIIGSIALGMVIYIALQLVFLLALPASAIGSTWSSTASPSAISSRPCAWPEAPTTTPWAARSWPAWPTRPSTWVSCPTRSTWRGPPSSPPAGPASPPCSPPATSWRRTPTRGSATPAPAPAHCTRPNAPSTPAAPPTSRAA